MKAAKNKNRPQVKNQARTRPAKKPAAAFRSGFTLIEVLMAVAVLSIGLLAMASMQISTVTGNSSSRMNTMAVEYAADYLERLLALGTSPDITNNNVDDDGDGDTDEPDEVLNTFGDLTAGSNHRPGDNHDDDGDGVQDIAVHPDADFNSAFDLTWTVTDETTADTGTTVKRITVEARWANGSRWVSLTSVKTTAL